MDREKEISKAINQRDIKSIVSLMFEGEPPAPKSGFKTETELWDYKSDCPRIGNNWKNAWADLASEVLGFYNHKGGVIAFGIRDTDFSFKGASTRLDSKLINDQLRKYYGDRIWVEFHREAVQSNQTYLGIALIPARGPVIERFVRDAPLLEGKRKFEKGGSALRKKDSTIILSKPKADEFAKKEAVPQLDKIYEIDEPYYKIIAPDYTEFIYRKNPCQKVLAALEDPRTSVTSIIGIGGVGKTALATWAVLQAYDNSDFDAIISITAKDRELTNKGITAIEKGLTTYESLIDKTLEVLGFPDYKTRGEKEKEKEVKSLLENSNTLLYIDNLETVDDKRVISFLDDLPVGCRGIVTSRRTSVRVSVKPIDLGSMEDGEIVKYIHSLGNSSGFKYVENLSKSECKRIGNSCDKIPLAIRWTLSLSESPSEAIAMAEGITGAGTHGEELLEFCFRRVFEKMPGPEKIFLQVLSIFQAPVTTESILVGADLPHFKMMDASESLVEDALVQRLFDETKNDYSYTILPIVRTFVYSQLKKNPQTEEKIRENLSEYYEAKDIRDLDDRLVVREIRQGKNDSESALVDLAVGAKNRGDLDGAADLFKQAIRRNPRSWKAPKEYAEYLRHKRGNIAEAIKYYERAAANAPKRGPEKARIYREWGILLRDSGDPKATDMAIERLEVALNEEPNDVIARHSLAHMYSRKGVFSKVVVLLEPLKKHNSYNTRKKTLPLLLTAYEKTGKMLEAAEIRPEVLKMG